MDQATDVAQVPPDGKISQAKQFYQDVKLELGKVSWPTAQEVYGTTLVVLFAVVFFGLFLWVVDILISYAFDFLTKLMS
jgi:preprotein translocase subunit SecE